MTDMTDAETLFSEQNADLKSSEAIRFISPSESKNGISPITVENVKTNFTGLTKEELMKYANDPFWIRIRMFLFVLFWIIWLAMLFGAIFIIIVTPKCKEEPIPLWWQKSPLYILDVGKLIESNPSKIATIKGILVNRIDYLKDLGVETLLLKNLLESSPNAFDEVLNFTNVNYNLHSVDTFKNEVVDYARSKGLNIILSFVPNHSGKSDMFVRSELGEDDYKDRYVWFPEKYSSKLEFLPNNWRSHYNTPAWEWSDKRHQFYLHQFKVSQPDFNFRNSDVMKYFSEVFKFWLDKSISGFHLDKVEYLVEDENFKNETMSLEPGYSPNEYNFYNHFATSNLEETTNIIKSWTKFVKDHSGIIGVSGGLRQEKDVVDFVTRPVSLPAAFNATVLNMTVSKRSNFEKHVVWNWKCLSENKTECFPSTTLDSMTIVSFLLPGTPVLLDDEFFLNNGSKTENSFDSEETKSSEKKATVSSKYNSIKELIRLRTLPAFMYGKFQSNVLNTTVFSFTRLKQGTPGFVVAWNIGRNETIVDFTVFSIIPENVVINLKSAHSFPDIYALQSRISSTRVVIPPMATIVLSFVPSTK